MVLFYLSFFVVVVVVVVFTFGFVQRFINFFSPMKFTLFYTSCNAHMTLSMNTSFAHNG